MACHSYSGGWRRAVCIIAVLSASISLSGCDRSPRSNARATEPPAPVVNVEWSKYVDEFVESYFRANPTFAVWQGRHEFDGQMPDWSADGIKKEIARLEQMRALALGFADGGLMPEERFQRDYVVSRIDNDLFVLREARQPLHGALGDEGGIRCVQFGGSRINANHAATRP